MQELKRTAIIENDFQCKKWKPKVTAIILKSFYFKNITHPLQIKLMDNGRKQRQSFVNILLIFRLASQLSPLCTHWRRLKYRIYSQLRFRNPLSRVSLRSNVSPLNWGKFSGPGAAETKYVQNSPQKLDVLMNFKTKSAIV